MPPHSSLEPQLQDAIIRADADAFDTLALEVFAYQYARNRPYQAFCDRRGVKPDQINNWRQIPAVPTSAFKVADLTCRPRQPSTLFLTSGTTQGRNRRGRHLVADLAVSHTAIMSNAQTHLFPDLPLSSGRRLLILSLTPTPSERPHSSLIHMIELLMRKWGTADSRYLGASGGLDGAALRQALDRAAASAQSVALFGTTTAFALWFDECDGLAWRVALPAGSRLIDTGGRKPAEGMNLPSSPATINVLNQRNLFLASCERYLALPSHAVVNEYGMTELGSQFYSSFYMGERSAEFNFPNGSVSGSAMPPYDHLKMGARAAETKNGPPMPPYPEPTGLYAVPSWVRVRLIDPATGDDVSNGKPGLLCHYDLANLHSVMGVYTDDIGVRPPGEVDGFHLLGRAAGSEPRGCSLDSSAALLVLQ